MKKKPAIMIEDSSAEELFRIENDGRVFWLKDGKTVQAKIDKDLGQAFAYVITKMGGYVLLDLIKEIKKVK